MNGNFTGLCAEYISLNTINIANIGFLEVRIGLFADGVLRYIDLDGSLQILDITEGSLAHHTLEHHTSCDRYHNRVCIHDGSSLIVISIQHFPCFCFLHALYIGSCMSCKKLFLMCNI